jgi:ribulose-phosphate 3-epimerase
MNISTSLICCDLSNISADLDVIVQNEGFNWLHADFMDGHFVPRYGISPELIQSLRKRYGNSVVIDSHLMVDDPYSYADVIAPYSDWFFFHYEAVTDPMRTLQMLRKKYPSLKIGLTFNTLTEMPMNTIKNLCYERMIDGVMFMGISPGVLGTMSFPNIVMERIMAIKAKTDLNVFIDGSVNFKTVEAYNTLGADVCVSGSSMMFKCDDETRDMSRTQLIEYNISRINSKIKQ